MALNLFNSIAPFLLPLACYFSLFGRREPDLFPPAPGVLGVSMPELLYRVREICTRQNIRKREEGQGEGTVGVRIGGMFRSSKCHRVGRSGLESAFRELGPHPPPPPPPVAASPALDTCELPCPPSSAPKQQLVPQEPAPGGERRGEQMEGRGGVVSTISNVWGSGDKGELSFFCLFSSRCLHRPAILKIAVLGEGSSRKQGNRGGTLRRGTLEPWSPEKGQGVSGRSVGRGIAPGFLP